MPEPLDLEPIKARLAEAPRMTGGPLTDLGDVCVEFSWADERVYFLEDNARFLLSAPADLAALIAEVERLRREADCWRDATHHLSGKRVEE